MTGQSIATILANKPRQNQVKMYCDRCRQMQRVYALTIEYELPISHKKMCKGRCEVCDTWLNRLMDTVKLGGNE